jgi:hypothetical protein
MVTGATMYLTVREALETLLSVHTRTSSNGEIEVRDDVYLTELPPECRDRYQAAWRALSEARQRSMF